MKKSILNNVIVKEKRQEMGYSYTYELIRRQGERTVDYGLSLYSIKISMTNPNGQHSEREATDVFIDYERALEFYNKLVRNLATPIDLGYVVEDEVRS